MLGAVSVAIAAAMVELLSGSVSGAASDASALNTVIRTGAALAAIGAIGLMTFGRQRSPLAVAPPLDQ